jgi:phenylacetate-CoA ligase
MFSVAGSAGRTTLEPQATHKRPRARLVQEAAMIESVFAQVRLAASLLFGLPFSARSLDQLVDGLLATRREFGPLASADELLAGPTLDEETRGDMQLRRFRAQAKRAARDTSYYQELFARLDLDPARLRNEDIVRIPLTPKAALRADPDAFVRRAAHGCFRTATTGTTGQPTRIAFSRDELHAYIALGAIDHLLRGTVEPEDVVLISSSARATLGNTCFAGACARIGAEVTLGGQIDPAQTLALLAEPRRLVGKKSRVSVISLYPSYLGTLVTTGLAQGYRPADFGLERILLGGETVTAGLKERCQQLFGPVELVESYGMTEPWPLGGRVCSAGHLHFEPAHGLVEVQDLDGGMPAERDRPGSLLLTPFTPFRETTILLRYDTEDVVAPLLEPPACELRHLPATGLLLGKRALAVQHDDGWTYPRDVLEALEGVAELSLPARCGFWVEHGGVVVELVTGDTSVRLRRTVECRLAERGVPLRNLLLLDDPSQLRSPLLLRCDLRDGTFHQPLSSAVIER